MIISLPVILIVEPGATSTDSLSTDPILESLTLIVTVTVVGAAVPQTAYRVTFDLTSMASVYFTVVAPETSDQPRNVLDVSGDVNPVPSGRETLPYATNGSTVPVPPFASNFTS